MAEISPAVQATETPADRYVIDSRASRFTVQAFATGLMARMGHNPIIGIRDFSGEMKFNPVFDGEGRGLLCQFFHRHHVAISGDVPTNVAKGVVVPGLSWCKLDRFFSSLSRLG